MTPTTTAIAHVVNLNAPGTDITEFLGVPAFILACIGVFLLTEAFKKKKFEPALFSFILALVVVAGEAFFGVVGYDPAAVGLGVLVLSERVYKIWKAREGKK